MATVPETIVADDLDYPTSDGRPMAETDWHALLLMMLRGSLMTYYADEPETYVSGNLLVFYEPGNRRRHLSPDLFVVKGVPKRKRLHYLLWKEKKGLDWILEVTSRTTSEEDIEDKFELYQYTLEVPEYFLFDPLDEYLQPPLQGYRLVNGLYQPIQEVDGRLPSEVLGLHLERAGEDLRLYNPATSHWLPTPDEAAEEARAAFQQSQAEVERLRQELEKLRRLGPES